MSNILKTHGHFLKSGRLRRIQHGGKELGMTTSAVSQHIRQLEEHLGIQLLLRSTRSLSLTEAGLCFYEDCLLMIHAAERGQQRIAALRGELVGELRVATSTEFATHYLVPALQSFLDEHPQLTLRLEIHDEKIDLITQRIDLAIRGGVLADSSYVSTRLARCREVLCASPAYLAAPRRAGFTAGAEPSPLGHLYTARQPAVCPSYPSRRRRTPHAYDGRLFTNSGMAMKEVGADRQGSFAISSPTLNVNCAAVS